MREPPQWSIHIDHPLSSCARDGAPLRLYAWTPWAHVTMALWPGHGSQVYDWKTGTWTDRWSWLSLTPRPDRRR